MILGPTGGYLIGYVPCAFLIGWMAQEKCFEKSFSQRPHVKNVFALALGTLACYALGTVWFLFVMKGSHSFLQSLLICVVPYLVFDLLKILAVAAVAEPVKRILRSRE